MNHGLSLLQRIGKLQEQTPVGRYLFTRLQAADDLSTSALALAQRYQTLGEFIGFSRIGRDINKRLIFSSSQYRGIWHGKSMVDGAGLYDCRNVHVFLELAAWIVGHDAHLQSPRRCIQRRRDK